MIISQNCLYFEKETQHKSYKSIADEIKSILNKFFKEYGGSPNGYESYVEGHITYNTHISLNWCTPRQDNMTKREIWQTGYDLHTKIYSVMVKHGLKQIFIIAQKQFGEYPGYDTLVVIPEVYTI
jgi:hypothetical protein